MANNKGETLTLFDWRYSADQSLTGTSGTTSTSCFSRLTETEQVRPKEHAEHFEEFLLHVYCLFWQAYLRSFSTFKFKPERCF